MCSEKVSNLRKTQKEKIIANSNNEYRGCWLKGQKEKDKKLWEYLIL